VSTNDDIAGWVVRVITQQPSGNDGMRALYAVALGSPDNAVAVVRARDGASQGEKVEAVDGLNPADIQRLGLKRGQMKPYQSTA